MRRNTAEADPTLDTDPSSTSQLDTIRGKYFGISAVLGHICYKQLQQKHPCLIIILTILVLEPDDGRETHGSAEQAGILLLLAPAPLGPGAGGAVHPGAGTNYLKQ